VNILIFNCGSSSLTYKIFRTEGPSDIQTLLSGKAHRVGVKGSETSFIENHCGGQETRKEVMIPNHREAAALAFDYIGENGITVDAIGHRFVHGGGYFQGSARLDTHTLEKLRLCLPLAPLHNPISLSVIHASRKILPSVLQYVTFDSAFHASIPDYAYTYALPQNVTQKFGYRKYGFHGLSYAYVTQETARFLGLPQEKLKIVACHLGTGGSSVAAIRNGRSIDTSMGFSPLPGLVMSTRSGDIDPMLTIYLMAVYGYQPDDLLDILNKQSGLLGISEASSDIRDIIRRFSQTEKGQAELAFDMYIHRLRKYIGSYAAVLGGIDALVFTDDIGVRNPLVREKVCEAMGWCGIVLDREANRLAADDRISSLNAGNVEVRILTVPTEEERVICLEGTTLLGGAE